jgi:hypothetical protein
MAATQGEKNPISAAMQKIGMHGPKSRFCAVHNIHLGDNYPKVLVCIDLLRQRAHRIRT